MLSALLLIILGYFLYKALVLMRRVNAVRHEFRRKFDEAQQQFGGGSYRQPDSDHGEKRYRQYEGEYVDFEEVSGAETVDACPSDDDPGAKYHAGEGLVSDAQYEEI